MPGVVGREDVGPLVVAGEQLAQVHRAELDADVGLVQQNRIPDRIGQIASQALAQLGHDLRQAAGARGRGGGGIEVRLLPDQGRHQAHIEPVLGGFGEQRVFVNHRVDQPVGASVGRRTPGQGTPGKLDGL